MTILTKWPLSFMFHENSIHPPPHYLNPIYRHLTLLIFFKSHSMGLLTLLILLSTTTSLVAADTKLSAYQVLQSYDFPVGILPEGVTSYELNQDTGEFAARLNDTCSFKIESYQLKYKSTITGVISRDRISKLKGVSVKVLLFWLNIVEVFRDGDELDFSVGIASADFPINNFEECPRCGCGFNCDDDLDGYLWSS